MTMHKIRPTTVGEATQWLQPYSLWWSLRNKDVPAGTTTLQVEMADGSPIPAANLILSGLVGMLTDSTVKSITLVGAESGEYGSPSIAWDEPIEMVQIQLAEPVAKPKPSCFGRNEESEIDFFEAGKELA